MDPLRVLDYLASPAYNVYHLQRTMTLYYNYSIVVWPSVYILPFYHATRAYKVISMFIRQRRFHARVSWCSEFLCHYIALHGITCLLPLLSAVMSQCVSFCLTPRAGVVKQCPLAESNWINSSLCLSPVIWFLISNNRLREQGLWHDLIALWTLSTGTLLSQMRGLSCLSPSPSLQ